MLKITRVVSSNQEITVQLDGRITGQWVDLLRESVQLAMEEGMPLTLDLENICFIDCEGLALIKSLMGRGVRQVNAPLFVAEMLTRCEAAKALELKWRETYATDAADELTRGRTEED